MRASPAALGAWLAAAWLGGCGFPAGDEASTHDVSPSTGSPVSIAHRGASAYAPEHTLAAYRLALDMGADFVEQDLQLTKDGVLVCLHDVTLERTTNVEEVFPGRGLDLDTSDGRQRVWRVSDFTLDEIRQLDAGSWFADEFAGARVPTFQEAIDLVKGHAGLYPETKEPEAYQGLGFTMEEELVDVLTANGLAASAAQAETPIFVQSFSAESLRRLRALAGTTYPLIQLVAPSQAGTMLTDAGIAEVATYATGVGPALSVLLADPSRAAAVRRAGLELHPYTVRASLLPAPFGNDATAFMTHLLDELHATGIFTDNPDLFPRAR